MNKELKRTLFKQKRIEQFEKELNIKEASILSLKKSHEDLRSLNNQQQELISQVFHYFLNKSSHDNLNFFDTAQKTYSQTP